MPVRIDRHDRIEVLFRQISDRMEQGQGLVCEIPAKPVAASHMVVTPQQEHDLPQVCAQRGARPDPEILHLAGIQNISTQLNFTIEHARLNQATARDADQQAAGKLAHLHFGIGWRVNKGKALHV